MSIQSTVSATITRFRTNQGHSATCQKNWGLAATDMCLVGNTKQFHRYLCLVGNTKQFHRLLAAGQRVEGELQ